MNEAPPINKVESFDSKQVPIVGGQVEMLYLGKADGSFKPTRKDFYRKLDGVRKNLKLDYVFAPSLAFTKRTGSVSNPMEAGYMVGPEGKGGVQEQGILRTVAKADGGILFFDDLEAMGIDPEKIALAGFNADCPFIVGYDSEKRALFMLHAGLGCLHNPKEAGKKTIFENMVREHGLNPDKIKIFVTAGIQKCCYGRSDQLFQTVFDEWGENLRAIATEGSRAGQTSLDLSAMIRQDLERVGVPAGNIEVDETCTCHSGQYFSNVRGEDDRNLVLVHAAKVAK
jgi:copper oxidase (laccase) domain-containing protein